MSTIRDLTDLSSCREVVRVQEDVWGRDSEVVPASVLLVSAKRGGILIGAFEEARLVGFVWSMPGTRDGAPTHWSHMLAVRPEVRRRGLGQQLKRAQRDRAIAAGVDLIEWTFDPLQAANAHLNISVLGGTSATYLVNAYGEMTGPLHRGTPTDRLVAEWWIRTPHVERRLAASGPVVRSAEILDAPVALGLAPGRDWPRPLPPRLDLDARRILVAIPPRFTEMQASAPDAALAWRHATREVFTTYFGRGYRVVDFLGDKYLVESEVRSQKPAIPAAS
ncbi:MAG TPA: GNAT family N-acetyltransferase [Vicinamibacterales bacterium]|nr:GNAT family N-acetyltransferase [Vicinamibacterales bacterium]